MFKRINQVLFLFICLLTFTVYTYTVSTHDASASFVTVPETDIQVRKEHPRMMITQEDLPALRSRVRGGGLIGQEYQELKSSVDSWIGQSVSSFMSSNENKRRVQVLYPALVYLIEGDTKYSDLAKDMLDWFLSNGEFKEYRGFGALYIALDWIYDTLAPQDKDKYFAPLTVFSGTLEDAPTETSRRASGCWSPQPWCPGGCGRRRCPLDRRPFGRGSG